MTAETKTRSALAWAIGETAIRLPPALRTPDGWQWDADDASLSCLCDDGEYRFHVAARRARRLIRIAVLSVTDDHGTVTWEADIPEEADA